MKVVHIESGLGNQMLSYCEYLALKKMNPDEDFFIENIIFDIPECNNVICQWNGYELERIFGIKTPANIKTLFTSDQWGKIMTEIRSSRFWEKNWNYPVYFTQALNNAGLNLENFRGVFPEKPNTGNVSIIKNIRHLIGNSHLGIHLKNMYFYQNPDKELSKYENKANLFIQTDRNLFTGQWLSFYRRGNNREMIDEMIHDSFQFPLFVDNRDLEMDDILKSCDSVAIHVRRGDALYSNAWCYKYGYFKNAVKMIRDNVKDPVFVFFTDPDSVDWCKNNGNIFGIDFKKEKVYFIDWHKGEDSFRDMQLMASCKHAIITTSSFGWWGAYFISNPSKMTISPYVSIDTTHHCY